MSEMNLTVRDQQRARTVENALEAAAADLGGELDQSRGRPGEGAVSTNEALEKVAEAYTGWSADE
jgi:hypothetical protein